ncbi:MAG: DUF3703 domain-containing protein [Proteobacteria bacterium]|nr:DUF3703 domain-containing protein [Pseudomonadota bacterium]
MNPAVKLAYERELSLAMEAEASGHSREAFEHLERAHILGQRSTRAHVRAHWNMLRLGIRMRDGREVTGQVTRLIAALAVTRIWVPVGNTGGANVSATKPMPIPEDLRRLLEAP